MQSKMTIKQQVQAACSKGHHEKELKILKYYLSQNPRYYMAYYMLGCYFYQHKFISEAEKNLIKSFKLIPNLSKSHPFLYYLAAEICLDKGELEEALRLANLASSMNMDRPILEHHLKGNILAKMGRYYESINEFKIALLFSSNNSNEYETFSKKIQFYGERMIDSLSSVADKEVALTTALSMITVKSIEVQQKCYLFIVNTALSLLQLDLAYTHCLNACQKFPKNKEFEKYLTQILQKRAEREPVIER